MRTGSRDRLGLGWTDILKPINRQEAEQMRSALKKMASFYNPALPRDGGQAAALTARETLQELGLFTEDEASGASERSPRGSDAS